MITIPSVLLHKGVAVYPDDEDCNLFYAIKTTPQIRTQDGQPIFSGLFWTDQADGSSDSVAGLAGGWINFDSHLGVDEETLNQIKGELEGLKIQQSRRKSLIKKEKERLGLIAKARGEKRIPDPDVPQIQDIRFGAVNFTEGTVTLLEEKEGDLIPWSSAGGPASLIGDNNAAFALRLSPKGAAIWYKALKEGVKAISIRYDLKLQLRLPSLEIRAWAGSSQKFEMNRKVERVWRNTDQGCSDADVERINVKEVTENLMEEGLVNIEIKKGSTEISDEHVSQLRNMVIKLIEEKVQEIIKSRIRGMSEDERKNSMIELIKEEVNSFVELRFTQEDVVEWQIAPQGTIMNFLEDIPESKKKHITKLVDLSEHEVETITINTLVDAPWEELPNVNAVKVALWYPKADEGHSKIFKKDDNKDVWHLRRPKDDDGIVEYTTEVFFEGISEPLVLPRESTNGDIIINIGKIGLIDVCFKPHPNLSALSGNNKINVIQVDISYKTENDDDHFQDTKVFKTEELEGKKLTKILGKFIEAPLVYKVTYFAKGGKSIEMPEMKYYLTENNTINIFTPNPYEDTLSLNVELPMMPDNSVKKIIVEFKYEDENNNFESEDSCIMSQEDDWESVSSKLVLLDKDNKKFQYRYRIISEDDIAKSAWVNGEGDSETIILPISKVHIDASQLKIGTNFMNALLSLQYDDGETKENREIFLNQEMASKPLSWYIPTTHDNDVEYAYNLTLIKPNGDSIVTSGTNKGKFLLLKAPSE